MTWSYQAYKNQGRVIVFVSRVDVHALRNHLLADLQVTPPTGLAEQPEVVAQVERVLLLQLPRRDGLGFRREGSLELVLLLDVHSGECK